MIIYENISETLVKAYSDSGLLIKQDSTGNIYEEAIDPIDCHRTYTEVYGTEEDSVEIEDSEALAIIIGGSINDENPS